MTNTLQVGSRVTCSKAFTTPTGAHFQPGDVFIVNLVGAINTRCHSETGGVVVWIADGWFLAQ